MCARVELEPRTNWSLHCLLKVLWVGKRVRDGSQAVLVRTLVLLLRNDHFPQPSVLAFHTRHFLLHHSPATKHQGRLIEAKRWCEPKRKQKHFYHGGGSS